MKDTQLHTGTLHPQSGIHRTLEEPQSTHKGSHPGASQAPPGSRQEGPQNSWKEGCLGTAPLLPIQHLCVSSTNPAKPTGWG
jgi:hypothetical protein